jgi:hypothetical protein
MYVVIGELINTLTELYVTVARGLTELYVTDARPH